MTRTANITREKREIERHRERAAQFHARSQIISAACSEMSEAAWVVRCIMKSRKYIGK
jgi:hypothetical protein